jgi:cytochrome b6-f complex iron-sulfur subunit
MLFGVSWVASSLPVAIAATSSRLNPAKSTALARADGFVVIGKIADLDKTGKILADNSPLGPILVVRNPAKSKTLTAVNPTCSHRGCKLNWQKDDRELTCPCHGAKFDASGKALEGPTTKHLQTYTAKIQGDDILAKKN